MMLHMPAPLIILEGPDGVGKTTLGKFLAKHMGGVFWHLTASGSLVIAMQDYQQNTLDNAKVNIMELDRPVIIDRHWPSELIYGTVFRPTNPHGFQHETFEKQIREMHGIYILCMDEGCADRHALEKDPDHPYDDNDFKKVVSMYNQFFGKKRLLDNDWVDYSFKVWGHCMADFASLISVKHHELIASTPKC